MRTSRWRGRLSPHPSEPQHDDDSSSLWVHDDDYKHDTLVIDSARVLREVAAKRALLDAMIGPALSVAVAGTHDAGIAVARHLAVAWSDHPDYRTEWAPA